MHTRKNGIVIDCHASRVQKVKATTPHFRATKQVMYIEMYKRGKWIHTPYDKKYIAELKSDGYKRVGKWYAEVPV